MAKIRVTWDADPAHEDGWAVYRDTSPLDPSELPAPREIIRPGRESYDDTEVLVGVRYHYLVCPIINGTPGDPVQIEVFTIEDEYPEYVGGSYPLFFDITDETLAVRNPRVKAGDLLVLAGWRRGVITVDPSWTRLPDPPDTETGGADQWSFMFWKIADGSETGELVTVEQDTDGLRGACILSFRHHTKPITLTHLDSVRNPIGPSTNYPIRVENNTGVPGLAVAVRSFSYAYPSSEVWLNYPSRGEYSRLREGYSFGNSVRPKNSAMRGLFYLVRVEAGETYDHQISWGSSNGNGQNANEQCSDIVALIHLE